MVLDETEELVRAVRGVLICRTHHGFVCANAGVDASNAPGVDALVLLPVDPDGSARALRARLAALRGVAPAIVIADSFGRAWRRGQSDVAIGCAGLLPLDDWTGRVDNEGRELRATQIAVADQAAAAADLARTKDSREPAVLVRGLDRYVSADDGSRRGRGLSSGEDPSPRTLVLLVALAGKNANQITWQRQEAEARRHENAASAVSASQHGTEPSTRSADAARRLDDGDLAERAAQQRLRDRRLGDTCRWPCRPRSARRRAGGLAPAPRRLTVTCAEDDDVASCLDLDDPRLTQPLLETGDARLEMRLVLLGDVVLGVLLEIAELSAYLMRSAICAPALALERLELGAQRRETLGRIALGGHTATTGAVGSRGGCRRASCAPPPGGRRVGRGDQLGRVQAARRGRSRPGG